MNYKKIIIASLIFSLLFLMACVARKPVSPEPAVQVAEEKEKIASKGGWQEKWERTLKAAQKEGRVVVYGGSAAGALKLNATRVIKEKFGLDLEVLSGAGAEIRAKISMERGNGLFLQDVYTSGVGEMYDLLKPMGALDPIEPVLMLPEVLDTKAWFGGGLPWGDEERKVLIWGGFAWPMVGINTDVVKPEVIKSYNDLLNPRWKGKITINDPTTGGGAGFSGFVALMHNKMVDEDFLRPLVRDQQPTMLRDQHLQILWLARGKFPIGVLASTGRAAEYVKAGAPIDWVTAKEGVVLSGGGTGLGLMNKAPHPNAARIFINWFLSKEGQLLIQNAVDKQSMRIDIPTDKVDPAKVRQPGVKYFPDPNNIEVVVLKEYDRYLALAKEIFGPLLR